MASIAERVKQIVAEQLGVDEDQVTSEASFMDEYTSSTFLPHTDLALFPEVQKLLESCRIMKG